MKIAYCILAHKNPEQVARLIKRMYSPSDFYYVHKDKSTPSQGWDCISKENHAGNVLFVSKYRTPRGRFGLVEATLEGMSRCCGIDYDYFVFLSGQCYPIKTLSYIKEKLGERSVAYLVNFRLPSKSNWMDENFGLDRINYFYFKYWKVVVRIPRLYRSLPYSLAPYGGSLYFCLPKRFTEYVLNFVSSHPKIIQFYRYAHIPDEMFFHTIIMNSPYKSEVVNDHKRYFNWVNGGHASVLTRENLHELVESDKWFAMKFDTSVDEDILDLLDRQIGECSSTRASSSGTKGRSLT